MNRRFAELANQLKQGITSMPFQVTGVVSPRAKQILIAAKWLGLATGISDPMVFAANGEMHIVVPRRGWLVSELENINSTFDIAFNIEFQWFTFDIE